LYLPTPISEKVGDIVIAIDTSGSIGERELSEFFNHMAHLCEQVTPDSVTVLWWDTKVHGQQTLTDGYDNLCELLKPMGGGGTQASCVAKYINEKHISADCVLVFTDGYLESNIKWDINAPTMWLVTYNDSFTPPSGSKVNVKVK
jgi:predicted metal-dependent peptidase